MHLLSSPVISFEPLDATDAIDAKAKWFAIQTKPRNEEKALCFLGRKAIPTFLPRLMVRRRHGSRTWQALEPLFPGYLFGRFVPEASEIDKIRWTPGINRILGAEGEPVPVPEDFIAHLWERVSERGYIAPAPDLLPGTRVRFKYSKMNLRNLPNLPNRFNPRRTWSNLAPAAKATWRRV